MDSVAVDGVELISQLRNEDSLLDDVNRFVCLWAIEGQFL